MATELAISKRTLKRWLNDTGMEPLELGMRGRVFLTITHLRALTRYRRVLRTADRVLIDRYRAASQEGDTMETEQIARLVERTYNE